MRTLIALLALLAIPAVAEAQPRSCKRGGVEVLAESNAAVLAQSRNRVSLYGCLKRDGKLHELDYGFDPKSILAPRAAGGFVAYAMAGCDRIYQETCASNGVFVWDLRRWRRPGSKRTYNPDHQSYIPDAELSANGTFVFSTLRMDGLAAVWIGTRHVRLLDAGRDIDARSLRREGAEIAWTRAGARQATPFR